jgi:hypothetical protein
MTEESELDSRQEQRDFSPLHSIQASSGAHSVSWSAGTWSFSPLVKQPKREADWPLTSIMPSIKMTYLRPSMGLHGVVLN